MGKQKLDRLLAQLKDNHSEDIQNAAAIFAVAQSAVNQLDHSKNATSPLLNESLGAPLRLTKADLIDRYGPYNGCRQAAKQAGIVFHKTPSWAQLIVAFNYREACQACISDYIRQYPNVDLHGISLRVNLE